MQKGLIILFIALFIGTHLKATICPGFPVAGTDVTLNTQAQVDSYSACDTIAGSLFIQDVMGVPTDPILDLSNLSSIKVIMGSLMIGSTDKLESLNGLNNIDSIGAALRIMDNDSLSDINALNGARVNLQIMVTSNSSLLQCCALNKYIDSTFLPNVFMANGKSLGLCNDEGDIKSDNSCEVPPPSAIPTMGEWALIHLFLLLSIIGLISIQTLQKSRTTQKVKLE